MRIFGRQALNKKYIPIAIIIFIFAAGEAAYYYFSRYPVAVLDPKGPIALKERNLLLLAVCLMLIVVIPVFILTFYIVYKYRDGHHGKYRPDFDHSNLLEGVWWLIPSILILTLSIVTWRSTYALNPYKTIASNQPNLTIEVVSLDWKWLFIYPQQHVASVNTLVIPVNRPVTFDITSDAPMNSLWIPQLSGQIYAMPGMNTQLNIMASSIGNYYGSSANISGVGFAGMNFLTHAVSDANFNTWLNIAKNSNDNLNMATYNKLSAPSSYYPITLYSNPQTNLYTSIINKYMSPGDVGSGLAGM